jgi:hypothetical protein
MQNGGWEATICKRGERVALRCRRQSRKREVVNRRRRRKIRNCTPGWGHGIRIRRKLLAHLFWGTSTISEGRRMPRDTVNPIDSVQGWDHITCG